MKPLSLAIVPLASGALLALALPASGQSNLSAQLRPITAPVKYAGVYHLGTGTWTHDSLPAASGSAGILYDNTCPASYFAQITPHARVFDEGRLPSPSSPVLQNGWGLGHDSEVGTQTSYTVDGFQISYCTGASAPVGYTISFYEAYQPCSAAPAVPTATFALTNLPGGTGASGIGCWLVDIDLCASSLSFAMQADANTIYNGTPGGVDDSFGWSFELTSAATPHDGYVIAGGQFVNGSYLSCSGSDGTVFDQGGISAVYPANSDAITLGCGTLAQGAAAETGSGMGSQDRFRVENLPPYADGCYWFGGVLPGNFHLQLYSANVTPPNTGPSLPFCEPASGSGLPCPCANPPSGMQRGCDNSAATGGAMLTGSGTAALAADTLLFSTSGELPSATTILVQGTLGTIPVPYGQGLRCVGGALKRLYVQSASGGSILVPGPGDPSVSARSAALGSPIASGSMHAYFAMYRDPQVLGACAATATFNCSQASGVFWN